MDPQDTQIETPEQTPEPEAQPQAVAPAATAAPAAPAPTSKVVTMPSRALAELRKSEREKGKKAVQLELDAAAKKLGYASHADMLTAVAAAKRGGATPAAAKPGTAPVRTAAPRAAAVSDKNRLRQEEELAKARRASAQAEKKYRRERRERERAEAEISLREAAIRSGIDDTEYALHLLRKSWAGKTQEELAAFDERSFFSGLRESHPQLFSVERVPATTGNAPKDPKAPAVKPQEPTTDEPRDASKMTREQYQARLDKMGIRNPALGYSH